MSKTEAVSREFTEKIEKNEAKYEVVESLRRPRSRSTESPTVDSFFKLTEQE